MRIVLLGFILLYGFTEAVADPKILAVPRNVWVYPKAFGQGRPTQVEKGQKIQILSSEWKDWFQVHYKDTQGRKKKGFLRKTDLNEASEGDCGGERGTRNCWAPFVNGVLSMAYQGKREIQTTSETIYDISEFVGYSGFFELGTLIPVDKSWSARLGLTLREIHMVGDAQIRDSTTISEFELTEKFIGLQAGLRLAMKGFGRWGLNGMVEYAKATDIELRVVNGPAVDQGDVEKPTHFFIMGGIDYEIPIGKYIFSPMIRGGASPTAEPAILIFESSLQLMRPF